MLLKSLIYMHRLFADEGYEIRAVGGAVRDDLINHPVNDIDFATTATPDEMLEIGSKYEIDIIPTGIDHGTVTFMTKHGNFEVTTLRKDVETDGRHAVVEFTDSWKEDAERRDFTFNAMSMSYYEDSSGHTGFITHDYFNGIQDLDNGIVRFINDADKRIQEDALRIVRFARFQARFGKDRETSKEAIDACKRNIQLLKHVSSERVWQEIRAACKHHSHLPKFYGIFTELEILEQFGLRSIKDAVSYITIQRDLTRFDHFAVKFPTFATIIMITPTAISSASNADPIKIANEFGNIFKLSNTKKAELEFFATYKDSLLLFHEIQDMIIEGVNLEWLGALAKLHDNHMIWNILQDFQKIDFPVRGQDLLDIGIPVGKQVGIILKKLRSIWKDSRYVLTREELLENI